MDHTHTHGASDDREVPLHTVVVFRGPPRLALAMSTQATGVVKIVACLVVARGPLSRGGGGALPTPWTLESCWYLIKKGKTWPARAYWEHGRLGGVGNTVTPPYSCKVSSSACSARLVERDHGQSRSFVRSVVRVHARVRAPGNFITWEMSLRETTHRDTRRRHSLHAAQVLKPRGQYAPRGAT